MLPYYASSIGAVDPFPPWVDVAGSSVHIQRLIYASKPGELYAAHSLTFTGSKNAAFSAQAQQGGAGPAESAIPVESSGI